jgi:hypothetical protein
MEFDTTTTSGTATGEIRLNNATLSSVTSVWLSYTDRNGDDKSFISFMGQNHDHMIIKSEVDGDYAIYEVYELVTPGGGNYQYDVVHIDSSGGFADGEDVTVTFWPRAAEQAFRNRVHRATHTDTTWYSVGWIYLLKYVDKSFGFNALFIGHSDDAATATWAYQVLGYGRNDGGVYTAGQKATDDIVEYDANYDARIVISGSSVLFQIRRNGGVDYDIYWGVDVRVIIS